jgi:hypothetical protein
MPDQPAAPQPEEPIEDLEVRPDQAAQIEGGRRTIDGTTSDYIVVTIKG